MNGLLIINKPQGITSFGVIARLRKKLNIRKMGHLGTLDPMATGVLVVAVNKATKLIEYLMGCDKTYEAEITLGAISNTFDADGEITQNPFEYENIDAHIKSITKDHIETCISQKFTGEITQVPPKYSALKIQGQKACDIMRKGGNIEMKSRKVTIHTYSVLSFAENKLRVRIACSTGTYIRSLAHDLGQELACGAYLTALKRTQVGSFMLEKAVEIDDVNADTFIPLERGAEHLPKHEITEDECKKFCNGIKISTKKLPSGPIAVMHSGNLIAIGEYVKGENILKPKKIIKQLNT